MNWVLALVIVAMVFVGSCALWVGAFTKTTTEFLDFAVRVQCYDSGYYDAANGLGERPPSGDLPRCDRLYSDGYDDGQSGRYDPPEE